VPLVSGLDVHLANLARVYEKTLQPTAERGPQLQ